MDLPLGLAGALQSGECVLFLGSGVGHNMVCADGTSAPDGATLAVSLAEKFKIDVPDEPDLAQVAQIVELRHGRSKLIAHLERTLSDLEPDENLKWLASLTWKAIYTTNYDRGIERAYEVVTDPTQTPIVVSTNSETRSWDPRFQVPVIHLHGSLFTPGGKDAILITEQDYARFRESRRMLFDQLRTSYATTPILYVGYSHRDANWRMVTAELRAEFEPSRPPQSYRLVPSTPDLEREILSAQGIMTVDGDLAELKFSVESQLGHIHVDPRNLEAMAAKIPSELREIFEASPAAVSRLLNSWDYVNQADFSGTPNVAAFHKGDRANWALIGQGLNFERDLEQPLVERLVEFATDPSPRVTTQIVLGSAGYGMSTLLMAVAAWFAKNKVGTTLCLRPGATPVPADVEFAARYFPSPIVFMVDNAADYEHDLGEIVELLQTLDIPAFLLLGERLNEWRQRRPLLRAHEHTLDPLSDDEIARLIESLTRTSSLGKLAELDADLRFSVIKNKNQQQLLVTMREATEGRAFDAIIEDEYRHIERDRARELYAAVCAFSRVRALARDSLCAEVLGIPVTEVYQALEHGLEGILVWETVDEARGIEALRSRHQIISEIVWNRCLVRSEREQILLRSMQALNLGYGVDAKAFEAFTRDEVAVDGLQTLEAKSRFFELACKKDPLNGFVRQHFGRMLRREGKLELALAQIERGIELAPKARAIQHTRGVILRDMAMEAVSPEVRRRRLAQSEDAFEGAIRQNARDEYAYQSLAELYLEWAEKASEEDEAVDYLNRAQEVVLRGLQNVRHREGLYLVQAQIERAFGDAPARLSALKQALVAAPTSAVVRYVLGNLLRRSGASDEAITVLLEGLTMHPDDPNLGLALALAYHQADRDYGESIAVLHIARMNGASHPAFIATYAGMLVMDHQIDEATDVWRRASAQGFAFEDANRIGFRPQSHSGGVSMRGRVSGVKTGYAFVSSAGFPDFFWPGSRFGSLRPQEGDEITFQPGFSARGAIALNVRATGADDTAAP